MIIKTTNISNKQSYIILQYSFEIQKNTDIWYHNINGLSIAPHGWHLSMQRHAIFTNNMITLMGLRLFDTISNKSNTPCHKHGVSRGA